MPFAPSSLFGSGDTGFALDPLDLTKVWQDSAGTVAGAVGSPVGLIDDISGKGNNLSQATSANRPTLQSDGISTNGSSTYLQLNGVDLYTPGAATFVFRVQGASGQLDMRILGMGNSTSSALIYEPGTGTDSVSSGNLRYFVRTSVATVLSASATGGGLDGTWHAVAITDTGSAIDLYIDGTHIEQKTYTRGSNSLANDRIGLGALIRNTVGNYFNGRIGRVIAIDRVLNSTELTNSTNWVSNSSTGNTWQFTSAVAANWSESATITRIRQMSGSTVSAAWAETSSLTRIRSLASSAVQATFSQSSTLSRLRDFVSSAAAAFSQTASFSQLKQLGASAVSALWGQNSALGRVRGFQATSQAVWSSGASLARFRGFSAVNSAQWSEGSALSRARPLGSSNVSAVWSGLAQISGNLTLLGASAVSSHWSATAVISFAADVTYPLAGKAQPYATTQPPAWPLTSPQTYPLAPPFPQYPFD